MPRWLKITLSLIIIISVVINTFPYMHIEAQSSQDSSGFSVGDSSFNSKITSSLSLRIKIKTKLLEQSGNLPQGELSLPGTDNLLIKDLTELYHEKIFLYFKEQPSSAQLEELSSLGITVYPDSWIPPVGIHPAGFMLADMPVDAMDGVAAKDYVFRLDTAERLSYIQNDLARAAMGVDPVWSSGYNGTDVTVAVLDSGIDTSNPDFPALNSSNSKDYSYYPMLDNTINNIVSGHGTHVTGSILGRGVKSATYKGVAPGANLVFLKVEQDDGNILNSALIPAIKAAIDVYHANIINLSIGGWSAYHDGTEEDSQAVDYAVSKGATVFAAAGNEGDEGWHYSGTVAASSTTSDIPITVASGYSSYLSTNLVWYDGIGIHNDLELQYYNSSHNKLSPESSSGLESSRGTEYTSSILTNPVSSGIYYFRVKNNSAANQFFHIYYLGGSPYIHFNSSDPNFTLISPAEADSAIAVGAYVTRSNWTNYQGYGYHYSDNPIIGSIATFSSHGPRIDNNSPGKPNIIAPGEGIISVRDNSVYPWPNYNTNADIYPYSALIIDNDGQNLNGSGPADYLLMQGTSMASPLAAGVGALLLSKTPTLTPAQVRHALEVTASKAATGRDNTWGWGLINAASAIYASTTLESYSDISHSIVCNDFSSYPSQHIAYMFGSGYLHNHNYLVTYYDGSNNKVASGNVTSSNSGTLSSQHTFVPGTDKAGTWHMVVSEPEFNTPSIYSANWAYSIMMDTAIVRDSAISSTNKLVFTTQPSGAIASSAFNTQPTITVQDAAGNTITNSSASVTLAITSGTGTIGAVLSGITTINAVNGIAIFSGLSINLAGTGYTLTTSSSGLTPAISSPFDVYTGSLPTIISLAPNSGVQGATGLSVVITGTNLTGTTSVSFGTGITVNSFTVNSSTLITANITISFSASIGTRNVSVTTPNGTGTLNNGFTVNPASQATTVSVSPSSQEVTPQETFTVDIIIDPKIAIAGVQFDLQFDPSLLTINKVEEGDLLKQGGADIYFSPGTINNSAGTVSGVAGAITTPGASISTQGTFARLTLTANSEEGTSVLNLLNVVVGDINGQPISIIVNNGNVHVSSYPDWDVNSDGQVNVLDMILVGQNWGQSGTPHWTRADVNRDGVVNVLDMILIGQHWGESSNEEPQISRSGFTQEGMTVVRISPESQFALPGEPFSLDIDVQTSQDIAGMQFDLAFDPSLMVLDSIEEGGLFSQNGGSTYFNPGITNNNDGTITGVAGVITTPGEAISTAGTFAKLTFTARETSGSSFLDLMNVIIGNAEGDAIPIQVIDGSVIVSQELAIGPLLLPDGEVRASYSGQLKAGGGEEPYKWSVQKGDKLPSGLRLNIKTGLISGKPSKAGTFTFTIQVTDGAVPKATASRTFTVTINPFITITSPSVVYTEAGSGFTYSPSAKGGDLQYTWNWTARDTFPPWIEIDPDPHTGTISGTPAADTVGQTYRFDLLVTDGLGGSVKKSMTLRVMKAVTIRPPTVRAGNTRARYSLKLTATGGKTPYVWTSSGDFPDDWATLNSKTGLISTKTGMKPIEGTYSFTVQVTDALGGTDTEEITIVINP